MSELENRFVKKGLWVNQNYGAIKGTVITTDTKTGTLVIALLAILSTIGTTHLWHLIAFSYHQLRADGKAKDGLFRQQQALLRQLSTPSSLLTDSVKLWWEWKHHADRPLAKTSFPILVGLVCAIGALAASISSSYVVDSSDLEVLVSSPFCGRLRLKSGFNVPGSAYDAAVRSACEPYAQECYPNEAQNTSTTSARCNVFIRQYVPLTVEKVSCPFDGSMCLGTKAEPSAAVAVDSGLVDVNTALGLNLGTKDRVKFRRRSTCGVLPLEGHTTVKKETDLPSEFLGTKTLPGAEVLLYHYGTRPELGREWQNLTSYYRLTEANILPKLGISAMFIHYANPAHASAVKLLPSMERKDADVHAVAVLLNNVQFHSQSDDLIYSVHKNYTVLDALEYKNRTIYRADHPLIAVGCTQQYQFCVATSSEEQCSDLNALPSDAKSLHLSGASAIQIAALQLLIEFSLFYPLGRISQPNAALKMGSHDQILEKLPDTEWITEVKAWESNVWAALQTGISDYAIGPSARARISDGDIHKPNSTGENQLCGTQRMRKSGSFVNINVFGLVFVVVFSILVAVIDIALLKFLIFMTRFRKALAPRIDRWIQDGVLQLQRRAYESQGEGTWTNLERDVPLTIEKNKLPDLPIETFQAKTKAPSNVATSSSLPSKASSESIEGPTVNSSPVLLTSTNFGSDTRPIAAKPVSGESSPTHEQNYEHTGSLQPAQQLDQFQYEARANEV